MHHKPIRQVGFTIVELLIVIVVIGILAAITIVAYNGIQQRARDAERKSDISAIQKTLELYYADNGSYPMTNNFLSPAWRKANLMSASESIFINPQDTGSTNSMSSSGSAVGLTKYSYYSVKNGGASVCGVADTLCDGYRMAWRLETDPTALQSASKQF